MVMVYNLWSAYLGLHSAKLSADSLYCKLSQAYNERPNQLLAIKALCCYNTDHFTRSSIYMWL